MPSRIAAPAIEVEPRTLAEWAAAQPAVVARGWNCPDDEAALELMLRNSAFSRRLAALYICAHTPAATAVDVPGGRATSKPH